MITSGLIKYGVFSFLVGSMIGYSSVNSASLSIISIIRFLALSISIVVLLLYYRNLTINRSIIVSIYVIAILNLLGLAGGLYALTFVNYITPLIVSSIIVPVGVIFFAEGKESDFKFAARYFVYLSVAIIIFLIATGGFVFEEVPKFIFDIQDISGEEILYNQGISKFFGMAAILSMLLAKTTDGFGKLFVFWILISVFAFLSFLGGGRGDFFALVITISGIKLSSGWRGALVLSIMGFLLYFVIIPIISNASTDIISAQRILVLLNGTSLGSRNILFGGALNILINEPQCLIIGCGFGFFQNYYGYEYGLYPHNILLEALIVWGAPIVLAILVFFLVGFVKSAKNEYLTWLGAFFTLIEFKSGTVVGSWFAFSFIYYHVGVGILIFIRGRKEMAWRQLPE